MTPLWLRIHGSKVTDKPFMKGSLMPIDSHYPMEAPEKFNLFCFPFAGGSYFAYNDFDKHMADHVHLVKMDLPGHGKRIGEPLLTTIDAMVSDLYERIRNDLDKPYSFYGHSLGALLSYRLAVLIAGRSSPAPVHLFLSGQQGPSVEEKNRNIYLLPKKRFIEKIVEYGGISEEVLNSRDLLDFMEPILRADFQAVGTYEHKDEEPLDAPMTVMIGSEDDISHVDAWKWQETTTREIVVKQFPGDHFFIFDHAPELCEIISKNLG